MQAVLEVRRRLLAPNVVQSNGQGVVQCEASSVPAWSEITERYEEGEPHDGSPAKERSAYVRRKCKFEDWRSVKQSLVTL